MRLAMRICRSSCASKRAETMCRECDEDDAIQAAIDAAWQDLSEQESERLARDPAFHQWLDNIDQLTHKEREQ